MKGRLIGRELVYDTLLGYRKIMCAKIWLHFRHAKGIELSDCAMNNKQREDEQAAGLAYIMSDEFDFDCDLLGFEEHIVDAIRERTLDNLGVYQISMDQLMMEVLDDMSA